MSLLVLILTEYKLRCILSCLTSRSFSVWIFRLWELLKILDSQSVAAKNFPVFVGYCIIVHFFFVSYAFDHIFIFKDVNIYASMHIRYCYHTFLIYGCYLNCEVEIGHRLLVKSSSG